MSVTSWMMNVGSRQMSRPLGARFARAAVWAIVGSVSARVFNFAAFALAARILGREQFGQLSIIQSTTLMFTFAGTAGFGTTAARYVGQFRSSNPARVGRVLGLSALSTAFAGLFFAMVLAVSAPTLATRSLGTSSLITPLIISSGIVLFAAVNGYQLGALSGFEAFRETAWMGAWSGLFSLPSIVIGCRLYGLDGAVAGLLASVVFGCVISHFTLRHVCRRSGIRVNIRECWSEASMGWKFALPAMLTAAVVAPANWFTAALLARQPNGFLQMGLFGAADRWRFLIIFIPTCICSTVIPITSNLQAKRDYAGMRKVFRANIWVNVALTIVLAACFTVLAHPMMSIFGRGYTTGASVLMVLSFSAIPQALNTILGQRVILFSMWLRLSFDCFMVTVLVSTAYLLVPRFGAVGLAAANASAYFSAAVALGLYLFTVAPSGEATTCDLITNPNSSE